MSMRDLGAEYMKELQDEAEKDLANGFVPELDEQVSVEESPYIKLFTKIKPTWSFQDQKAIEQLKVSSNRLFLDVFGDSLNILDDFYNTIRVPMVNETTGVVLLDEHSRPRWKTKSDGEPIEDWKQLNGQDVEKALFDLQRLKMVVADRCSSLFLEAVFAKHILSDEYHSGYERMLDGTVGDRDARARRDSTDARYHAFFRYYLWYRSNTFQNELRETMRILERIRQWRITEDKSGGYYS